MNIREKSVCELLIDYLTDECSDVERKRIERHLVSCPSCAEEADAWQEIGNRMAENIELVELPDDLKVEVLGPLLGKDEDNGVVGYASKSKPIHLVRRSAVGKVLFGAGWASVVLLIFMAGWLVREMQFPSSEKGAAPNIPPIPASIETLFHLSAQSENGKFEDSPRAYGVACLVRSDLEDQLVVYVFGTPQTKGNEAYQVWLMKDGQRSSAGTFTVGSTGIGIMTLPLSESEILFDAVGVTLEPDNTSTSPRGPKMFGSYKQESKGTI